MAYTESREVTAMEPATNIVRCQITKPDNIRIEVLNNDHCQILIPGRTTFHTRLRRLTISGDATPRAYILGQVILEYGYLTQPHGGSNFR